MTAGPSPARGSCELALNVPASAHLQPARTAALGLLNEFFHRRYPRSPLAITLSQVVGSLRLAGVKSRRRLYRASRRWRLWRISHLVRWACGSCMPGHQVSPPALGRVAPIAAGCARSAAAGARKLPGGRGRRRRTLAMNPPFFCASGPPFLLLPLC